MAKLKLGALLDDKPVKITADIPAETHRNLVAYAQALEKETGQPVSDPARLIPAMLDRFMASDRAFTKSSRRTEA
ncbi:DUF2274 domain-containing protein [Asticcacaulis taihuensis]|uniref:DUF2274 domain-containing protein n=1 Tax=Asticcacaulis taihuensis TaxID=260084 RepID=UPI0026EEC9B4|nr:DUF2274 domain-containing protein [Asticcacaulis taihuensis]